MATTERRGRTRMWPAADGFAPPAETDYEPAPRTPGAWRAEIMSWSGLNVLAGIWLIISPFVLSYSGKDATWNPIVFGAIVGLLALGRFGGAFRATALSWLNMAIGVWLFISAWWLADTARAAWNVGVMGVVVFVLAALSAAATKDAMARRKI